MTQEDFERYQEETFDSFCKTVIRNEGINAHVELAVKAKHEMSLADLGNRELSQLAKPDNYELDGSHFHIFGEDICVRDTELSDAMRTLPLQRQKVILLSYFLGMSDVEIGHLLGVNANTVGYHRHMALQHLQTLLEGMNNG